MDRTEPIFVVGHNNSVFFFGSFENIAVVVADNSAAVDPAGRRPHDQALLVELGQKVLVSYGTVRSGGFASENRNIYYFLEKYSQKD